MVMWVPTTISGHVPLPANLRGLIFLECKQNGAYLPTLPFSLEIGLPKAVAMDTRSAVVMETY